MKEPEALEGWAPEPKSGDDVARVIDLAFDYRGDVTIIMADGTERTGYIFNRDREVAEPFLQILESQRVSPLTIHYAAVSTILFSGKDTAAGKSYAAWLERKMAATPEATSAADA